MGKTNEKKKNEKLRTWLLSFEKLIGKPVVVSLLIQKEHISFVSCLHKKSFTDEIDDEEDNEEEFDKSLKHKLELQGRLGYIG